jgi:membrane protein DedA with SNARE-associated domain
MIGISGTSRIKFSLVDITACSLWTSGLGLLIIGLDSTFI